MAWTSQEWQYASPPRETYKRGERYLLSHPDATVGEMVTALFDSDKGIDYAVPQTFVDRCRQATGIDISGQAVTSYRPGYDGEILPLTLEAAVALYGTDQIRHDLQESIDFYVGLDEESETINSLLLGKLNQVDASEFEGSDQ